MNIFIRYYLLFLAIIFLVGCSDLQIRQVNSTWDQNTKTVSAEVANNGPADTTNFDVSFTVENLNNEAPLKTTVIQQIVQLDKGDTTTIDADFSVAATPENRFLTDSSIVTVTADPNNKKFDFQRSNNVISQALSTLQVGVRIPTVRPKVMHVNTETIVTFSVRLEGRDALTHPKSVELFQVTPSGSISLATLKDDGLQPDSIERDNIYTGKASIQSSVVAQLELFVNVSFENPATMIRSENALLQVLPQNAPLSVARSDLSKAVPLPGTRQRVLCNEIMIVAIPDVTFDVIKDAASIINGEVIGIFPGEKTNSWQVKIPCNSAQGVLDAITALQGRPGIIMAEPHGVVKTSRVTPNDTDYGQQWGLTQVQADIAWALSRGIMFNHFPIPVAVVDTGVDYNHNDLTNIWLGQDYANGDNDPMDDHNHGSHVAGIVAATAHNNTGVAGMAQTVVFAVKVLDSNGEGTWTDIASGIENAADLGANVINLSLGGSGFTQALASAMDYANTRGRLLVAAAGNDNCPDLYYPAAFNDTTNSGGVNYDTSVIAVGATDANDLRSIWIAGQPQCTDDSGSNFGNWVDIYAPGSNIRSTIRNNNYANWGGTSMATPHVSGTAALMWARDPVATANEIRDNILNTAQNTGNTDPDGNQINRLNTFHAVMQSVARNCIVCPDSPEFQVRGNHVDLGVAGRARTDSQPSSRHGAALPLLRANWYMVDLNYHFETWDSYAPVYAQFGYGWTGPRDAFSVSISHNVPYWWQTLPAPLAPTPTIHLPLVWGGLFYKDQAIETKTDRLIFIVHGRGANVWQDPDDFLNVVLDTNNNTDYPSWGWVEITDITPTYANRVCFSTSIAGNSYQMCNGP